jgi:hypothetical protein
MKKIGRKISTVVPIWEIPEKYNRKRPKDFRDRQYQFPRALYRRNRRQTALPLAYSSPRFQQRAGIRRGQ